MSFKEKFERMIDEIERLSNEKNPELEIPKLLAQQMGYSDRIVNASFSFITGTTLSKYIKERKLMAAYKYLIEADKKDNNEAIDLSGYNDQSSFTKSFKKMFGITPGAAWEKKDTSRMKPRMTWEQLESGEENRNRAEESQMNETTVFGVSIADYKLLLEVFELQSFYGLSEEMTKAAYHFSKKHNLPMSRTFHYFSENSIPYKSKDYIDIFENDLDCYPKYYFKDEEEYIKKEVLEQLSDPEWIFLFFDAGFTEEINDIVNKARAEKIEDVRSLSMTVLRILANDDIPSYFGLKAAKYYDEHKNDEFKDKDLNFYIEHLEEGDDYTEAFFWTKLNTDAELERMEKRTLDELYTGEKGDEFQAMIERNKDIIEDGYKDFISDVYFN